VRIGISTSVIQRGKSGIVAYVFALLRSFLACAERHEFIIFALEEDLGFFDFARGLSKLIPVSERFRPQVRDILWHQDVLPSLARRHGLDLLHVPSYRRLTWAQPCALVAAATWSATCPRRLPRFPSAGR
jgi:hypothetical protein